MGAAFTDNNCHKDRPTSAQYLVSSAIIVVLVASALFWCQTARAEVRFAAADSAFFHEMLTASLDSTAAATVHDLTLSFPDLQFQFKRGIIRRVIQAGGRITGLYFDGSGTAVAGISDRIEASWLDNKTEGEDGIERYTFHQLYCRCANWNELKFSQTPVFTPSTPAIPTSRLQRQLKEWFADCLISGLPDGRPAVTTPYVELFEDIAERHEPGCAYAVFGQLGSSTSSSRFYCYNPRKPEQINYNGWCRYSPRAIWPVMSNNPQNAVKPLWFDIEAVIKPSSQVVFHVEARYLVLDSALSSVYLHLAPEISMHGIDDRRGLSVTFWEYDNAGDTPGILLFLNREYTLGDTLALIFDYSGQPEKSSEQDTYSFPAHSCWFPTTPSFYIAAFDAKFICPIRWTVLASGRKIKEQSTTTQLHSYWVLPGGAPDFAFAFGTFTGKEYFFEGLPPVSMYTARETADSLDLRHTAAEILNILGYFRKVFGPYPFPGLTLLESPAAPTVFPAFVLLPPQVMNARQGDLAEVDRGNAIAGQWWGGLVRGHSNHDRWFIEGVADYFSALHILKSRKRNDLFSRVMHSLRDSIIAADAEFSQVPVWRGETGSSSFRRAKSAWIIHMLRVMMIDLGVSTDSRFMAMLRDFLEYYRGREVTTRDFQAQAELYYGDSLGWFFRQWVHGAEIPSFRWHYQTKNRGSEGYEVLLEVEQLGVGEEFAMPVPVTVTFPGRLPHRCRVQVSGKHTSIVLGPFSHKPETVNFNDFDGVLTRPAPSSLPIADTDRTP